ncbi:glycosyltransferase family protein [Rubinisphaera margarita]|uniref:glycosyltransferase family protein n=1 Tax=Rubinisphaera margarita TaxID=2909586 RepID=UPI001EE8466F|nr:glycosyltransferase [Rubinisphaera margarita]MCG6156258.1 sulfotransferase domain-containing protein [Rubinisphaera margarita]
MIRKVLLVSGSANFSTRDVWDGYRTGLQVAGINVVPYPTFSMLKVLSIETVCAEIIGTALDVNLGIDCVIFIDGLYFRGERGRVPLSIRKAGIPTVLVATDDPYEEMGASDSLYQYRFSNERRSAEELRFYLPTATLPPPPLPPSPSPTYDLSFLGTVFEDRLPFLKQMAHFCHEQNLRMVIAGKFTTDMAEFKQFNNVELRSRTIEAAEKWELYAESRVTLNLFRESQHAAVSPSPRVFEVTGYGHCALLSGPHRKDVDRLFGDSVYQFQNFEQATERLQEALGDSTGRTEKVRRARDVTLQGHLYHHRASRLCEVLKDLTEADNMVSQREDRLAWVIGYGRSGSTWLAEMLGDLPKIRRWHEPYFGRIFRYLADRPEELDRPASFYSRRYQKTWISGVRDLFFNMVQERYPTFGRQALVIKEVNTPELYPWIRTLFPAGKLIFLARDPFDTLDSYLDLQAPGSWNEQFGQNDEWLSERSVRRTCEHIRSSALAAAEAYESFPELQRLRLNYEDLLTEAAPNLIRCGQLVGIEVDPEAASQVADAHRFDRQVETGPGKFRRKGKAGVWRESEYFTPEVLSIAEEVLGPIRTRLGYS